MPATTPYLAKQQQSIWEERYSKSLHAMSDEGWISTQRKEEYCTWTDKLLNCYQPLCVFNQQPFQL